MSRKNLGSMKELISGYRGANRKRNWILISTIALTVFVIFSVFSIAKGKITADTLRNIRSNGTCADGRIKNGTQKQYDALKKLSYVEIVGRQNSFAYVYQDEVEVAACVLLDNNAYRKLKEPAIDEMKGTFPSCENEVMMSTACLESMKITNPKVGIKIPLTYVYKDWSIDGGKENQKTFVLSGFYQDYSEENGTTPEIVFSEAYRTNHHLSWDGADLLIKLNSGVYDGRTLEDKLYSDVEIDTELNQQIIVEDSARYAAVEEFVGGFGIAVISVMVLLISAYLMISNVLAAGLTKEIRQYGLLKSIGATQKQVHHISRMQSLYISFMGIGIAIVLCVLFGITLLPTLIGKLYMQGTGTVDGNALLSPGILILSIFAVMIMMKVADRKTAKLLRTITPLQAYHYTDIEVKKKDGNPKNQMRKEAVLFQMAKRNVFRSRKKFVITVVSLFLGIEVALCSVVIGTGINKIHEIRQTPDFVIETKEKAVEQYLYDIIYDPVFYNGGNGDTKPLFSEDFYKQLVSNGAVNQDSIETVRGSYTSINSEEASINVYFNTRTDRGKGEADTLQIISESYIHQLEKYVNDNGLKIDIDNFKKGEGVIMLHRHALAPYQEEKADELVGEPIHLYLAEDTADSQSNPAEVLNCGYLDVTEKAFPKLDTTWMENGDCYFIVSEAGFKKIDILEQKFKLSFDAKEGKESALKKQLLDMIAREKWADKNEQTKIGFDPMKEPERNISTRAYIGAKTKKMQSRVRVMEHRIQKEITDKEGLLKDIEEVVDLKVFPMKHHKNRLCCANDFGLQYADAMWPIVEHLNFELCQGERLFLEGSNGCGKTSLIKSILRHSLTEEGADKSIYGISDNLQEKGCLETAAGMTISYINQDTSFLRGSIAEFCKARELEESLFCAILRQLDMSRIQFEKDMKDYSEGQKKKVLIAASLMTPAHLYIWDEPLNYIDIFSRMQIEKLILQNDLTMLLVEHDVRFREKIGTKRLRL